MAILKSIVDVNNGNTGWTSTDVMDALETVFANLGYNGGTNTTGVPQSCKSPAGFVGSHESWRSCGGGAVYRSRRTYKYVASAIGTSAYRMLKEHLVINAYYFYADTDPTHPNEIRIDGHGFTTGQAVHWAPGGTIETQNVAGLTLDTIYYIIVVDDDYFKLAANATDAANDTAITLSYGGWSSTSALKSNTGYNFRDINDASFDNRTINIGSQDVLQITLDTAGSGNMYLCYDTDDYDANKHIVNGWSGQTTSSTTAPTGMGSDTGTIEWYTAGYYQSYTDPADKELFHPSETLGSRKYIYANDTNSGMKGEINVYPQVCGYNGSYSAFWDYEVPASGGRSALKLRVSRYQNNNGSYYGRLSDISILTKGTGWTNDEVFTIPGDQIGGITPDNDVTFGVGVDGDNTAGDGTPSLRTTTLGSGSNFYQKANSGNWAVLKNVNDASKTYGTTYYSFGIASDSNNDLVFNCGSGYKWLNVNGIEETNGNANAGRFTGQTGLDRMDNSYDYPINMSSATYWSIPQVTYCSTSTPTAYPLEIRVYRAQAPQDTNFAIIQFCQTINNIVQPYGAFTIYKGATFGSNVWDFDHVFNGSMMIYSLGTRSIRLDHTSCSPVYSYYSSDRGTNEEPVSQYSIAREAFYGYLRDPDTPNLTTRSEYVCNIETDDSSTTSMYLYYRNSVYDQYEGNSVASDADYYKPFKGLPINERMVPCPYYLPDDFVMLSVSTTPGLTQFRTGDTVTIGGTETYEIIRGSYQTQQNGLDGVDNNSTIGMLFLARIS